MGQAYDRADAVVIGAGPAGLTAALYLARYHRKVLVLHDGTSRALRCPETHNAPGFPDGVKGKDLIALMTRHAETYGAEIIEAGVTGIERDGKGFVVRTDDQAWPARAVILATGVSINQIEMPQDQHEQAIADGVLRYCPVCDGYEGTDRALGVIGCDSSGAAEALFLRQYSDRITLMPLDYPELTKDEQRQLDEAGIIITHGALDRLEPNDKTMVVHLETGGRVEVDVLYPALGMTPRSDIVRGLGVEINAAGCLGEETIFGSRVPGFFAAGDVVEGLDQISVASGHGAIAATKAHNWLRDQDNETLD
jgi:thioredoxin reductase (NADPH)